MTSSYLTRNVVLKGVSAVYLVAFMSLYMQIPGLYGVDGILPAHVQLEEDGTSLPEKLLTRPTLLWLRGQLGLNTQHAMELLALCGAVLALLGVLLEMFRTSLVYVVMLLMYGSLVHVGQLFFWYQWDTLLLETGLLAALLAPLFPWQRDQPWDALGLFLMRWLLFRVTFSSGMAKLLSRCPTWWGLTALETLFESHWLPTPLAWYAHQLPGWLLQAAVVGVFVVQIAVPFLFFAPIRRLRLFAFWCQVFLQTAAMATGNCNFYNALVLVLCLSLVDDDWLAGKRQAVGGVNSALTTLATFAAYAALLLSTVSLFELRLDYPSLASRTAFSKADLEAFGQRAVPGSVALATAAFLLSSAEALTAALMDSSGCCRALDAIWRSLVSVVICAAVFSVSMVPFAALDPATEQALPSLLRDSAAPLQEWRLLTSYGLHKQMITGGRPEVVIEGAHSVKGSWKEIEFRYKPGNVDLAPAVVFPHQPRLDWQMWHAAAGSFHDNPWLTSLAYRLLTGQPEVLRLLDVKRYPFAGAPPKYVRALKYNYKYTAWKDQTARWWQRSGRQDYLPIYTAEHKPLLQYLTELNIIGRPEVGSVDGALVGLLERLRAFLDSWEPARLLWALLLACWAVGVARGSDWYR